MRSFPFVCSAAFADSVLRSPEASDYVWSTWNDSELHDYAVSKGLLSDSDPTPARKDLITLVSDSYNNVSNNAYDTWSDSRMRYWLAKHGVVKAKEASTRDELVDLMSRSYYGAKDTSELPRSFPANLDARADGRAYSVQHLVRQRGSSVADLSWSRQAR